jgi:hypothetical protein
MRKVTPPKYDELYDSRTTKSNKAYKIGMSQERIYQPGCYRYDRSPIKCASKRSCYDYVPEELKTRLKERQYGN